MQLGDIYGKWTVLGAPSNGNILCKCACGIEKKVRLFYLLRGTAKQCIKCTNISRIGFNIGDRFGKWLVVSRKDVNNYGQTTFECKCDCGFIGIITAASLKSGLSKGCKKCGNKSHGRSHTSIYSAWGMMKARCLNPNSPRYRSYGGRGIKVCERWLKFDNFLTDMGERPPGLQINRVDPDGNYEPDNCRWVTPAENAANRRCSKKNRERFVMVDKTTLCGTCCNNIRERDGN